MSYNQIITKLSESAAKSQPGNLEEIRKSIKQAIDAFGKATDKADELMQLIKLLGQLVSTMEVDLEKVEAARAKKFADRGGFDKRIFMEWFILKNDNKEMLQNYLHKPEYAPTPASYKDDGNIDGVKLSCNKLVRHNMERLAMLNYKLCYYRLDDADFDLAITNKVIEEAQEVLDAQNLQELISEMGDAVETLSAYARFNKINFA
jgi:predicted house-cleaning noncanonical NTP pyrophosphatase (MazG superfamily)